MATTKKIVSEDTTLHDDRKGASEAPSAGIYLPNYKAVNHIFMEAPDKGKLSFNEVLSSTSKKMIATQESIYKGMERDSLIAGVNAGFSMKLQEFDDANVSGQGHTAFATETYSSLISEAANKSSNSEVSSQIRMIGQISMPGIANNAVQFENQKTTAYVLSESEKLLSTKYNQILNNPNRFDGLMFETQAILNNLEKSVPQSVFKKISDNTKQASYFAYGLGICNENPKQAEGIIKGKGFVENLNLSNYKKLLSHAVSTKSQKLYEEKQARKEYDDVILNNSTELTAKIDSCFKSSDINVVKNGLLQYSDSSIRNNDLLTMDNKKTLLKKRAKVSVENAVEIEMANKATAEMNITGVCSVRIPDKIQSYMYNNEVESKKCEYSDNVVPLFEKAKIATRYTYKNIDLGNQIKVAISNTNIDSTDTINAATNSKKTADACIAGLYIHRNNPAIINQVSARTLGFYNQVCTALKSDPNSMVQIVQGAYFSHFPKESSIKDEERLKALNTLIKETNIVKNPVSSNWFSSKPSYISNPEIYEIQVISVAQSLAQNTAIPVVDILENAYSIVQEDWQKIGNYLTPKKNIFKSNPKDDEQESLNKLVSPFLEESSFTKEDKKLNKVFEVVPNHPELFRCYIMVGNQKKYLIKKDEYLPTIFTNKSVKKGI